MTRLTLERQQVFIYLLAIAFGLALGSRWPGLAPAFEALLWPALVVLLYATFVQVPLLHLGGALRDRRFMGAVLLGNFVLLPLGVWAALPWLPADPVLRLGVLLVLLVPCTDWFITFTALGGGHVPRAVAVTPLNLVLQLLLLPAYVWLMLGEGLSGGVGDGLVAAQGAALGLRDVLPALAAVSLPLLAAAVSERWMGARSGRGVWRERLAWWPVPLLALVVLLIAGAQVGAVRAAQHLLPWAVPLFAGFLLVAVGVAKGLALRLRLPPDLGRTLAFSLGTRNSFVVLPFALALPPGWEAAAVLIVLQSLVELLGMVLCLWALPRWVFADRRG
ncbi:MAG: arsenic resistance protein [Hydrogenophaga sp.]|nr:arsenic resistance protein [Hydrogenophaga sp.]